MGNFRPTGLRRPAFTLVELLVVIAIIGVLVGLLLPAVQSAREAARRMHCNNNLKQVGLALHNYHDIHQSFPPDAIWLGNPKGTASAAGDQRNYTWIALILPFIEQSPLHDQIDFAVPGYGQLVQGSGVPEELQSLVLTPFLCPSDGSFTESPHNFGYTSYAGNAGWDRHRRRRGDPPRAGVFSLIDPTSISDIKDGTSNTIMVGEVSTSAYCISTNPASSCYTGPDNNVVRWRGGGGILRQGNSRVFRTALVASAAWEHDHSWILQERQGKLRRADGTDGPIWHPNWVAPYALAPVYYDHYAMNVNWPGAGSVHPGGANFCLADASVRFISETISTGQAPKGGTNANRGINGNVWVAVHTILGGNEAAIEWP